MSVEIVVRVGELDCCRYFYREVLGLGEPLLDSTFAVVFALSDGVHLVLEKCGFPYLEHASAATSWSMDCADLAAVAERMEKNGTPLEEERIQLGRRCRRGFDPEGNSFVLSGGEAEAGEEEKK